MGSKKNDLTSASIVVATYNNSKTLQRTLNGLLDQSFDGEYEIIVVNDGSSDDTSKMMKTHFAKEKKIRFIDFEKNQGVCKARNAGILASRFGIIINMDHDCIPEKKWLSKMIGGFDSPRIGVVSAYDYYGGTSTAFLRTPLLEVGGYDEEYRYYREDTDLSFKIMDKGFEFKLVDAKYEHDHTMVKPKGFFNFAKHVLQRLQYHQNDVLLWKKHPTPVCAEFLHVKWGFLVDPKADFSAATGLWRKNGKLELSSPRGITFMENKSPIHALVIFVAGIGYLLAVKFSRLIGSIRFGKLLI